MYVLYIGWLIVIEGCVFNSRQNAPVCVIQKSRVRLLLVKRYFARKQRQFAFLH